jgi:hypothetical protein
MLFTLTGNSFILREYEPKKDPMSSNYNYVPGPEITGDRDGKWEKDYGNKERVNDLYCTAQPSCETEEVCEVDDAGEPVLGDDGEQVCS